MPTGCKISEAEASTPETLNKIIIKPEKARRRKLEICKTYLCRR